MNDDLTGTRKGDYEILGVLGAGGMGKVYKVRNVLSDRVEAMKVLLPNLAGQKDLADRFLREIKVLASLNHPNIASLRTALTIDNQLVMIMEYVEGTTLAALLDKGPLQVADALNYIGQILAALSYAHQQGVIHRDIKPGNMMLTLSGVVKLMDFGIARSTNDLNLTMTGSTVGSLAYMSPEQVRCEPIDARSDLYSVGVSLYELVTGRRPFQGESSFAVMQAHLDKMPKSPDELVPSLPAPLTQVIMMGMAKDRMQRFQTAEAFRNAIASVGASLGVAPAAQAVAAGATKPSTKARLGAATVPIQQSPVAAPPPAAASSHRGMYMALGALIVVAVLVVAGIGVPRWLHTRANNTVTPAANQSALPAPAAVPTPAPATAATLAPATDPAPTPAAAPKKSAKAVEAPEPPQQAAVAVPTGPPPPDPAVVAQIEHDLDQATSRAAAVNSSLGNLQAQQNAHGYGLRGDMVAAQQRMQTNLNRAQSALQAQDVVAAQKYLDQADRDISKLEEFLGH